MVNEGIGWRQLSGQQWQNVISGIDGAEEIFQPRTLEQATLRKVFLEKIDSVTSRVAAARAD